MTVLGDAKRQRGRKESGRSGPFEAQGKRDDRVW